MDFVPRYSCTDPMMSPAIAPSMFRLAHREKRQRSEASASVRIVGAGEYSALTCLAVLVSPLTAVSMQGDTKEIALRVRFGEDVGRGVRPGRQRVVPEHPGGESFEPGGREIDSRRWQVW